jgi:hypothetical protein
LNIPAHSPKRFIRSSTRSPVGFCISSTTRPSAEDDPVGVAGGHRVVGDHDDGLVHLVHRSPQDGEHLGARPRVPVAGRLVGEDDLGAAGQRPGHGDLLLAAGQLAWPVLQAVAYSQDVDDLADPRLVALAASQQ